MQVITRKALSELREKADQVQIYSIVIKFNISSCEDKRQTNLVFTLGEDMLLAPDNKEHNERDEYARGSGKTIISRIKTEKSYDMKKGQGKDRYNFYD